MTAKKSISFETRLKTFKSSVKTNMSAARDCAEMALVHFQKTGDLVYLQQFFDAMPKNYLRRTALIEWAVTYSPAMLDGGTWKKDKKGNEFNIEQALKVPFWEFKPEPEVMNFSAEDFKNKVLSLVKRFENPEKTHAKDEKAKALVKAVKAAVAA